MNLPAHVWRAWVSYERNHGWSWVVIYPTLISSTSNLILYSSFESRRNLSDPGVNVSCDGDVNNVLCQI